MRVWAVANQKGGVGKTTTAVSLAGLLVGRGLRTLLVDLDPHGSMTSYFQHDPDRIPRSVYHLFQSEPPAAASLVLHTPVEGLDLLPASTALATLDRQLGAQPGKGLVIGQALAALFDEYDYALMDCPPVLGVLMVNALAACRRLLIPVQTEFLALKGLERMLRTLAMVTRSRREPLDHLIVPTLFDRRTRASIDSLRALRESYGARVWAGAIPIDTQFREASRQGMPLPLMNARARGSEAYAALLDTLLGTPRPAPAADAEAVL